MTMSIEQAAINLAVAFCLSAAIGFELNGVTALPDCARTLWSPWAPPASSCLLRWFRARQSDPCRRTSSVGDRVPRRRIDLPRGHERARAQYGGHAVVFRGNRRPRRRYATLATGFVVFVNLLLRPIVSFINRQPLTSTELEIGYRCR